MALHAMMHYAMMQLHTGAAGAISLSAGARIGSSQHVTLLRCVAGANSGITITIRVTLVIVKPNKTYMKSDLMVKIEKKESFQTLPNDFVGGH